MNASAQQNVTLSRYRLVMTLFIIGLVLSGITAFPLLAELGLLAYLIGVGDAPSPEGHTGLPYWILTVRWGLEDIASKYPWNAYGTDWLAFGHVVIALFFVGPWIDPVRNSWVLRVGLVACALVLPLALICGPLRGIPFYWQLIDCSFGILGALPLLYCLHLTRQMERAATAKYSPFSYSIPCRTMDTIP